MTDIWFISDTHFLHRNILSFKDENGDLFRGDHFSNVEEHDELMIQNWNKNIKVDDDVYHAGDVFIGDKQRFNTLWSRLNGKKKLVCGNHDPIKFLAGTNPVNGINYFRKMTIWRLFKDHNFILTHVPIPKDQFRYKVEYNVHGHQHEKYMKDSFGNPDPIYINICVEHTNWSPIHIEDIKLRMK